MNTQQKPKTTVIISQMKNEEGIIFIAILALIAILAIIGSVAAITTTTDLKISSNYKTNTQAFFSAEAGIEEARSRLRGQPSGPNTNTSYAGDDITTPDPSWCAYIVATSSWQTSDDPDYNASYTNYFPTSNNPTNTTVGTNTIQTASNIPYWVKIKHKREYDAELQGHTVSNPHYYDTDGNTGTHTAASPGNIIYWGFGDSSQPATPVQFTAASTTHKPVDIITSYGYSSGSKKITVEEVASNPGPPILAALYSKTQVDINGHGNTVDGNDECGAQPPLDPIYTMETVDKHGNTPHIGPTSPIEYGTIDIDFDMYIDMLKEGAQVITNNNASNITYWGSASDYGVWYADATGFSGNQLTLNNVTGYGLLLVNGELNLGGGSSGPQGGFSWNGLILCTGEVDLNGGGGPNMVNIHGAILGNDVNDMNGCSVIEYSSCTIANALYTRPVIPISWKMEYNN
ncbi:MAG: hypothetical protein E3K37_12690 [Candidatus Kuenenia sp.]|nr:hypothetical protein [Candidatus Kuenenia hertensis]